MGYWSVQAALDDARFDGSIDTLISLVQKGRLSVKDAAEEAHISEEQFRRMLEARAVPETV